MFRKEATAEEVLGVAARLRAAAPLHAVLARTRVRPRSSCARRADSGRDGVTLASARCCARTCPGSVLGEATPLARHRRHRHHAADHARRARTRTQEAGLGPDDVDVVECQDTDAARELLAYEELGLCARGRAGGAPRRRRHRRSAGRRPVNPSRRPALEGRAARRVGARSGGRARAASSAATPGSRQVDGARVGLAHTVGRGANASVTILTE